MSNHDSAGVFELAQREGVPTVIENKYQVGNGQIEIARVKLAAMRNSDHLVAGCRAAVVRANKAAQ
jgi:hypothetical protein